MSDFDRDADQDVDSLEREVNEKLRSWTAHWMQ